jgi:hypothetical protein
MPRSEPPHPDPVTGSLAVLEAHEQVSRALMALWDASSCPGCRVRELQYIATAVDELLLDAEKLALQAGVVH